MITVEVSPGVWLAARRQTVPGAPHEIDAVAAAGMARQRAAEFLAGRAILRDLLADVHPAAASAPVVPGANGKPGLVGWPGLGMSVSHDGGVVAACVAVGHEVGVDVQVPETTVSERMILRCARLHADELAGLAPADKARELAWIWTAQEACVKAEGTGLAGRPWSIDVPPGRTSGVWCALRWHSPREISPVPLSCAWRESS